MEDEENQDSFSKRLHEWLSSRGMYDGEEEEE
jgi:hypothetical protein